MEKLRTIDKVIEELRAADPDTALTGWALRNLIREGKIPSLKIGNKNLVSREAVERYVNEQFS